MKSRVLLVVIGVVTFLGSPSQIWSQPITGDAVIRSPFVESEIVITAGVDCARGDGDVFTN